MVLVYLIKGGTMMTARAIAIGSKEQAATVPYHKYQPARFGLVSVCGVVWCGVVWCGVVWCGVVWCGSSVWTRNARISD
jgi:hypothetical protein